MTPTTYETFWRNRKKGPLDFSFRDRDEGIRRWGFAIPNAEAIDAIAELSPIIELGAGTGYWASLLAEAGAAVQAYDKDVPSGDSENYYSFRHTPLHYEVKQGTEAVLADSSARTLLLVWPSYASPFANNCLKQFAGEYLAFVGEGIGGCTADDDFFEALTAHWEQVRVVNIPHWDGIHDDLRIYRRNK